MRCVPILGMGPALMTFLAARILGEGAAWPPPVAGEFGHPPPPMAECAPALDAAGVRHEVARYPVHRPPGRTHTCGAAQVVRYRRGPGGIRWSSSPRVTCQMALGLARFEEIVQEEAARHLGTDRRHRVYRIRHLGTYACREMAAYPGWVSEHSHANAIDIAWFQLANGRTISVREHYENDDGAGRFLRALTRRLVDDRAFAAVLTPRFDAAHRGHLHLDWGPLWVDGTGPDGG